jgi:hydrogenase expression/formation protein HypD
MTQAYLEVRRGKRRSDNEGIRLKTNRYKAFRDPELVRKLQTHIAKLSRTPLKIMEFCGTHTHAICRFGIA